MGYTAPPLSERIILHPGEHRAVRGKAVIQTLLGSCVAVCLYDELASAAGMNHFLLANRRYSRDLPLSITEAGRYGIQAMELLINDLLKLGADKRRLKAKAFGAGQIIETSSSDNFECVGDVNSRFIREFLKTEGIVLVSEDLGGPLGRVIHFHTDSGQVFRRFIKTGATIDVERKERDFWTAEIENHEKRSEDIILFK